MSSNTVINSAEFTNEQKEYLQGFFAGVSQRGLIPFVGHTADGRITNDPASGLPNEAAESEPLWFNTPVSDLSKEERWKFEQNPFTIWEKLLQYSNQNQPPTEDDRFRIKYFGLFHVAPAQDSFMLRLRVPGGILTTYQLRGLAQMAEDWGSWPRRSHHSQQSSDPRAPAQRYCPRTQSRSVARHELARLRRRQHPQHHRLAHHWPRSSGAARRRPSRRSPAVLHLQLSRHVRAATQVQRRLRQRWRHLGRCRHQRHRLRRRRSRRRPQRSCRHLLPRSPLRHHRPSPIRY